MEDQFGIFPEMLGVQSAARPNEWKIDVPTGTVSIGCLPGGCTVLDMKSGLFGKHALMMFTTDQGVFVAEVGKSRLTKLEPIE